MNDIFREQLAAAEHLVSNGARWRGLEACPDALQVNMTVRQNSIWATVFYLQSVPHRLKHTVLLAV
eukprot:SAG31_NODE_28834_length_404_cov_1.344262_1_plen_65_part_01